MQPAGLTRRAMLTMTGAAAIGAPRWAPGDDAFLEDLSRRSFQFFLDHADPETGLVLDRALASGASEPRRVASSAATGFGLTALCIGAARGWKSRTELRAQVLRTLRFYAERAEQEHGWFYHFVDKGTGARQWKCELSSIDTALLVAGVLSARSYFGDREIRALADTICGRIDWQWMCNGDPHILTMGWKPESGFLKARWDHYCELMILYLLGIGAKEKGLPAESWWKWRRPRMEYGGFSYVSGAATLFTHQYTHAWVDFRGRREKTGVEWFENSALATRAHRAFCVDLGKTEFPGCYDEKVWGVSASDSAKGYHGWGGPPKQGPLDGTVVPCAAGGSLMFEPALCVEALRTMKERFGSRIWGPYGFTDAFHAVNGWTNPDVIGIDVGITLLSAENARTGSVWKWTMQDSQLRRGLAAVGL